MKNIRTDDVIVARSDVAAAEPLPDGLAKKLYSEPIIVREDMVLIDGNRRLLWHRAQGHENVPAIVVSTFLEALSALTPQHAGRSMTCLRLWNMLSTLDEYQRQWAHEKFSGGWTKRENGTFARTTVTGNRNSKSPDTSSRYQLMRALNVSQHTLQSTLFLYRRAEQGDTLAGELVERAERGEISIIAASRAYRAPNNMVGHVTDLKEQQQILERGVTGLEAQVTALQKLGHPLVVSTEELAQALDGLVRSRMLMTQMIIGFRKILKERENDGQ